MKTNLYALCLFILSTFVAVAQQADSTQTEEKEKPWEFTIALGLNLSHTLHVNPRPGASRPGFSTTDAFDLGANCKVGRFISTNEAHWQFSLYKSGAKGSPIQKSLDALNTLHDVSVGFSKTNRWNANVIAKITTGLLTSYNGDYLKDTTTLKTGPIQKFLNPYEIFLSPGIKFQPTKYLRVSLSPYSIRIYGLIDQKIADTGLYIESLTPDGKHYVKQITEQQGAVLNIWYDRKIKKWLQMQYRIDISSNYFDDAFQNGTLNGLFITKIKLIGNIYLTHRGTLKANLAEKPLKPNYSQVMTLSYAVTF